VQPLTTLTYMSPWKILDEPPQIAQKLVQLMDIQLKQLTHILDSSFLGNMANTPSEAA
jgi:hypothetical protein